MIHRKGSDTQGSDSHRSGRQTLAWEEADQTLTLWLQSDVTTEITGTKRVQ